MMSQNIPNLVDLAMVGRLSVTEPLGREDIEDARCWGWNAMLVIGAPGTFMGLCVIVFGKPILALFLTDGFEAASIPAGIDHH